MATIEFDAFRWPFFARSRPAAAASRRSSRASRPRLAVISTYNTLCGIASYTRSLERQLNDIFDITIFDLDQYLLRATHRRVRRFADRHIRDICYQIGEFDAVNLQLEHGILGHSRRDIYRRFRWIVRASPRISVTFHTVFVTEGFDYLACLKAIVGLKFARAAALRSEYRRARLLSTRIARCLRNAQRFKPVAVIVHTPRDHAHMKYVHGLHNVYDHPLAFLSEADADSIRHIASRRKFAVLDEVPNEAKLVGVFGFFGRYKGFETVVRALHHLPEPYHLLIFSSVHPNEIKSHRAIDPVLSSLFEAGFIDTSIAERIWRNPGVGGPAVSIAVDTAFRDLLIDHPKDLSERIHFLGARTDGDFLEGMAICDAVVFPYLEVGQSASGPISQSLELGCRIIASRTHTFLQFSRYHPQMIEFFDIGNHLELAARIAARAEFDPRQRYLAFDTTTNKVVYLVANMGNYNGGTRRTARIWRSRACSDGDTPAQPPGASSMVLDMDDH
jgi:glycosyltransferase involved in cell wall biosynthesis